MSDALNKAMNEYLNDMADNTAEDGKMRSAFRVAFRCGWVACELQAARSEVDIANILLAKAEEDDNEAAQEFHETLGN